MPLNKRYFNVIILISFCLCPNYSIGALKINEFLAANDLTNQDPQGDYDDWIEIYNSGSETIDLSGYYLTDDLNDLTKWSFPQNTTIVGRAIYWIWADKDTSDNPSGIHCSF